MAMPSFRRGLAVPLLVACSVAGAAPPPKAGGKLLTKDELRACITLQDGQAKERTQLEERRATLERDKAALESSGGALAAELAATDRSNVEAVAAYNAKAIERDRQVDEWNGRNAALVRDAQGWQGRQDDWTQRCANRRYREDDEKAIRAGS